jgi:hypothetical protein
LIKFSAEGDAVEKKIVVAHIKFRRFVFSNEDMPSLVPSFIQVNNLCESLRPVGSMLVQTFEMQHTAR